MSKAKAKAIAKVRTPDDDTSRAFREWVQYQRDKSKWGLDQLANESSVSKTTIWAIEKGFSSPSLGTVNKICGAFGVKVETAIRKGYELLAAE